MGSGGEPAAVSRRVSVVVGFYRTCVIDQVLPQSPADYVRRPAVQRAIERAVDGRTDGPILGNLRGSRMGRRAATRRLKHLAADAGVRLPRMHPRCCVTRS